MSRSPSLDSIGLLEIPADVSDDDASALLDEIEESARFTAIYHGALPHTGARIYRIEIDDGGETDG